MIRPQGRSPQRVDSNKGSVKDFGGFKAMKKTVKRFTIENGVLSGPAKYMEEQGNAKLDRILAGEMVGRGVLHH